MEICGHKEKIKHLDDLVRAGKLASAYLFSGPEGIGKLRVAVYLSRKVSSPNDTLIVSNLENSLVEKDFPFLPKVAFENSIKIENIRKLTDFLSLKSLQPEKKRVIIVNNFHLATLVAQNSFLKTLEEPGKNSLIILISHRPEMIIPTIKSRLQRISFNPLGEKEIEKLLREKMGSKKNIPVEALKYSEGRASRALKITADFQDWHKKRDLFLEIFHPKIENRLRVIGFLEKNPSLKDDFFEEVFFFLKDILRKNPVPVVATFLGKLVNFYFLVDKHNLNFNWQLEYFVLSFPRKFLAEIQTSQ